MHSTQTLSNCTKQTQTAYNLLTKMTLGYILLEFGGIHNNSLHKIIDDRNDNNIVNTSPLSYNYEHQLIKCHITK